MFDNGRRAIALLICLLLGACTASQKRTLQFAHEIALDGPSGEDAWKLDPDETKVKLEDGVRARVATYRLRDGGIRLTDAAGSKKGFVVPSRGGFELRVTPTGDTVYRLRSEPDGDYRLENGTGRTVYEIKKREYGYKIIDAAGNTLHRVRVKGEKTSLDDASGNSLLSTRDPISPLAVACFGLADLDPAWQGALAVAILQWGG